MLVLIWLGGEIDSIATASYTHSFASLPYSMSDRRYDVVLFGATGFTGRLVAEYLARTAQGGPAGLRWAIAGRNRDKLEAVRAGLGAGAAAVPILVADSTDRAALDGIARDARVVCSTVGPFALHGRELVAACVEAGTDYCDSTGEPQFVRAMIDRHHARARETGARIVPCCGFDSVPSDLGTLLVQQRAREEHGAACAEVRHYVSIRGGAISGGTAASMVQLMEEATRDGAVRKLLADPYALDPDHGADGAQQPDGPRGPTFDRDVGRWVGPFLMAAINVRVVRRTNALLGYAWGRDFRYREGMAFGRGARGWMRATTWTAGIGAAIGAMALPPVRRLAEKTALPRPGEGPSKAKREASSFESRFVGVLEGRSERIFATVRGVGDPGYDETAKMLGESALGLAFDRQSTRTDGGVLTPASCLGTTLIERLRRAGMTFEA
jgi:short subunit dehydrogenase-like uncharacterized protein